MKKLLLAGMTAMILMGGCDLLAAKYVDTSGEEGIREIVSTSRKTKVDLLLLGVDSYPSRKKVVNYQLVPFPGFAGPEVLSRAVLPQGAVLHFTGARRCTNCSPQSVELSVVVDGLAKEEPIYIDMSSMSLLE